MASLHGTWADPTVYKLAVSRQEAGWTAHEGE